MSDDKDKPDRSPPRPPTPPDLALVDRWTVFEPVSLPSTSRSRWGGELLGNPTSASGGSADESGSMPPKKKRRRRWMKDWSKARRRDRNYAALSAAENKELERVARMSGYTADPTPEAKRLFTTLARMLIPKRDPLFLLSLLDDPPSADAETSQTESIPQKRRRTYSLARQSTPQSAPEPAVSGSTRGHYQPSRTTTSRTSASQSVDRSAHSDVLPPRKAFPFYLDTNSSDASQAKTRPSPPLGEDEEEEDEEDELELRPRNRESSLPLQVKQRTDVTQNGEDGGTGAFEWLRTSRPGPVVVGVETDGDGTDKDRAAALDRAMAGQDFFGGVDLGWVSDSDGG